MPDNTPIRCLIIEDEPLARQIISRYVQQTPTLQLAGECANAIQAFTFLQQQPVDLMFLDIRMPQLNGNDFLKTLQNPPKVIFTTAYPDYALESYEFDAVDYLMKPITFERFLKAVNKACGPGISKPEARPLQEEKKSESFVYFRSDRKMIKVMLQDILYVESMKDYVKIFTSSSTIISRQSISSVEAMLPEKEFIRTHR
ncbi:MAG TPA: response regulator transcription factor, partial [Chitinophagaceae bacterium]|nr:response regulator transcription factor [Chitinophagaceae bacterium]